MHAYIDETTSGKYALCVVTLATGDLTTVLRDLRAACPPGHSRIHMSKVGSKHGPGIVAKVARMPVHSRLYVVSSRKYRARQARDLTLTAAMHDLDALDVSLVVIESCDQDQEDRRAIKAAVADPKFEYRHDQPSNPGLWLPDVHGWAWQRGGKIRQTIESKITVVPVS